MPARSHVRDSRQDSSPVKQAYRKLAFSLEYFSLAHASRLSSRNSQLPLALG